MSPTIKVMASKHGIVVLQGDLEASCTAQRALCELMASFRWERYRMLWSSSDLLHPNLRKQKGLNVDLEADQVRGVLQVIQNLNKHDTIMRIHDYVMWL